MTLEEWLEKTGLNPVDAWWVLAAQRTEVTQDVTEGEK